MSNQPSILFLLPVAFLQKPEEPGFQVQTQNFRTTFEFVLPELVRQGMEVELVSLNNTETQLENGREYMQQSGLDQQCRYWFFKRSMGRGKLFPQLIQFFLNLKQLSRILRHSNVKLLYGYNDVGTLYGVILKTFFRFKLAYDMRGNRVNEMAVQGAPKWRVSFYRKIRNLCLRKSDVVLTVSKDCYDLPKEKYHLRKYNFFDEKKFWYDADMGRAMRSEMGLDNRFVFVYSGTDKYYQMVPQMVEFFAEFLKVKPDAYFMINLPVKSQKFIDELNKRKVPDSAWGMNYLTQETLNKYQMVVDMAFLIRENLPLNHEAFPTKFSEYLASGVPVLITPHVHTLKDMVEEHQLGEVWQESESIESIQKRLLIYQENLEKKGRCAAFARKELSWQTKAAWLAKNLIAVTHET
jgi:glycosyltransferase involved in cell wall biosynthesis